jgi:hypothetical protein
MTAPLSTPVVAPASVAPVAAATAPSATPLPGAEPTWPTNPAVPVVTPRRTSDKSRTAPRPLNGRPTNGAAGAALPLPPAVLGGPVPTWPPEPAGEPLPPSAVFAGAPDVDKLLGATPAMSSTRAAESPRPPSIVGPARVTRARLPRLADLQFDVPDNLADWLVAAGSGVALVGFLLPWSSAVVGARNFGGYTDSWGLAVPSHFLVMLLLGVVLTLAVMPSRVPSWIRTGILGVLVGGLLIGLAWPYLMGGLGASLGILFEAVAAALLIAGGVTERRTARHAGVPHSV